jgi:hypothetical protein
MTLNASGAISLAGTTAGQSIEVELGGSGTAQISLNDSNVRTLAGVPSGAIIMPTNFWGKSNGTPGVTFRASAQLRSTWSAYLSVGAPVSSIAFGNSTYVVSGGDSTNGTVAYGSDGLNWTNSTASLNSGANNPANTVTYGLSLFVVGTGVTYQAGKIFTSPDGATWTSRTSPATVAGYYASAYNGSSTIVICGNSSEVAYSTNGTSWTSARASLLAANSGTTVNCTAITFGNGKFIIGTSSGQTFSSSDGITWTNTGGSLAATTYGASKVYAITYGASKFVVGGVTGKCATSPDGTTWTYQTSLGSSTFTTGGGGYTYGIAWNGSLFLIVGYGGYTASSPDGVTWTGNSAISTAAGTTDAVNCVLANGTKFVMGSADFSDAFSPFSATSP